MKVGLQSAVEPSAFRQASSVLLAVLMTASVVQYIVATALGEDLSTTTVLRSLAFASPLALLSWRGHLGIEAGRYPSSWFLLLALWTLSLAPSLVATDSPIRAIFIYDQRDEDLGRLLFLVWNWIFALGCPELEHPKPSVEIAADFSVRQYLLLVGIWAVSIAIVGQAGYLSNYTGFDSRQVVSAGGIVSVGLAYKSMLSAILPALAVYQFAVGPAKYRWMAPVVSAVAIGVLVLIGGRREVVTAAMAASVVAHTLRIRINWPLIFGIGASMAALMLVMFATRAGLAAVSSATTSNILDSVVESVIHVASESEQRDQVLEQSGDNIAQRFGYAPQLYAAISVVQSNGPAFRGTLFEGLIRMAPSIIFPDKNAFADDASLESALWASGHFPIVDLGPTPWLQWVFELGFPWVLCGPLVYIGLARLIQELVDRRSFLPLVGGLALFNTIVNIEHQTDLVFLLARDAGLLLIVLRLSDMFGKKPKIGEG